DQGRRRRRSDCQAVDTVSTGGRGRRLARRGVVSLTEYRSCESALTVWQERIAHFIFGALIVDPDCVSANPVTSPFSFRRKVLCASVTLYKDSVSEGGKISALFCPVSCAISRFPSFLTVKIILGES